MGSRLPVLKAPERAKLQLKSQIPEQMAPCSFFFLEGPSGRMLLRLRQLRLNEVINYCVLHFLQSKKNHRIRTVAMHR